MRRRLLAGRLLVAALFAGSLYPAQATAEEARRTSGVLVSSSSAQPQQAAPAAPVAAKNTLRLRFVPKNPPANAAAQPSGQATSIAVASGVYEPPPAVSETVSQLTTEEEYALARSRQKHPLAVNVEDASPVKQVVGSPKTIDYSTARTAYVLDPGQPSGGGSGTVRMRSRAASTES